MSELAASSFSTSPAARGGSTPPLPATGTTQAARFAPTRCLRCCQRSDGSRLPAARGADPVVFGLHQYEAVLPDLSEVHHLPGFPDGDDVGVRLTEGDLGPLVAMLGADAAHGSSQRQAQGGGADQKDAKLGC